jgi:signal transduction histidine kinase
MRYGSRYLYGALATGSVAFSAVVLCSEYWQRHFTLGASLWFGVILLPLFYLTIIERLHASNARLAAALSKSEAATTAQAQLALENARLLREAQDAAEAMRAKNAELDSFVYTVSHDLKAPLVTIQGMAGLLATDHAPSLDSEGRRYLERIDVNARRMEGLLLDLLSLARVGREAREPEEVALATVVDELAAELAPAIRARGITLTVGSLPTMWAVRVQLEQLLRNLLTNAVKYMGDTPTPAIEVGAAGRGSTVEVWVRDTGIGIDHAYHERIFEIFQRLKQISADGTGVGLAIVKKIVERVGGRIWVESAPGEGSTFRFTWPAGPWR